MLGEKVKEQTNSLSEVRRVLIRFEKRFPVITMWVTIMTLQPLSQELHGFDFDVFAPEHFEAMTFWGLFIVWRLENTFVANR